MNTDQLLPLLSNVRSRGSDKWIARCPGHQDRRPSLAITETPDKILLKCWAGCPTEDVCAAIGIQLRDLFHDNKHNPDPAVRRRGLAAVKLRQWRDEEITRVGRCLRNRDTVKRAIADGLESKTMTEEQALTALAWATDGYAALEYQFERLLDHTVPTIELWREVRAHE